MDLDEFSENYLNTLLDKIPKKNKSIFLLGDFNVDLFKYDKHAPTNGFLDSLSSDMFLLHIVQPTRISTTSKTLIDNIFSNIHIPSSVSGNLTSSISDHLPQCLIVPDIFLNLPPPSPIFMKETEIILIKKILFLTIWLWIGVISLNQKRKT